VTLKVISAVQDVFEYNTLEFVVGLSVPYDVKRICGSYLNENEGLFKVTDSHRVTCAIIVLISRSSEKVQVRDILITVQWSSNRKLCVDWTAMNCE